MALGPAALRRTIAGELGELETVRVEIEALLHARNVDRRAHYAVELVLEELGTNVLRHGYGPDRTGPLTIEVQVHPDRIEFALEDEAPTFDPRTAPAPDRPQSLEAAQVGGLGLSMVASMTSRLEHDRLDGGNRVRATIPRTATNDASTENDR